MIMEKDSQSELDRVDKIYEDSFDDSIEQSTIYRGVHFPCIKEEIFAIVLTPTCDIYWDKAQYIRMVGFIPAEQIFEQWLKKNKFSPEQIIGIEPLGSEKKVEKLHRRFAKDYLGNSREIRYHFIPSYKEKFPHSFVDFQLVESFSPGDVEGFEKVAVLKSPWRESILARYASYCGRVGIKTYSEKLIDVIVDQISRLTWPQ